MAVPQHKNPCPGVMKFTILVDPFLVIITLNVVSLVYAWEKRRRLIFKEIHQFYPKFTSLWGGGHEIYNFLSAYPTDASYQIW